MQEPGLVPFGCALFSNTSTIHPVCNDFKSERILSTQILGISVLSLIFPLSKKLFSRDSEQLILLLFIITGAGGKINAQDYFDDEE